MEQPGAVVNVTVRENFEPARRTSVVWKIAGLAVGLGLMLELAAIANELHSMNQTLAVIAVSTMGSTLELEEEGLEQTPLRDANVQTLAFEREAAATVMVH